MRKARGFIAIEYAAILPLVLFVTAGVYDLVRMFQAYSALRQGLQVSAEQIGKIDSPAVTVDVGTRNTTVSWRKRTYQYQTQKGEVILSSMREASMGTTQQGELPAGCSALDRNSTCFPVSALSSDGIPPSRQLNFEIASRRALEAVRAVYPGVKQDCSGNGCVRFRFENSPNDARQMNLIGSFNLPLAVLFGRSMTIATSKDVRFESTFTSKKPHHASGSCERIMGALYPNAAYICGPNNLP